MVGARLRSARNRHRSRIVPEETEDLRRGVAGDGIRLLHAGGRCEARDGARGLGRWPSVLIVVEMPIKCPIAPIDSFAWPLVPDREGAARQDSNRLRDPARRSVYPATRLRHPRRSAGQEEHHDGDPVRGRRGRRRESCAEDLERHRDPYDMLVTIPTHIGSESIDRSDMGDELGFIPTQPDTLQADGWRRVRARRRHGPPSSKAGSVAHFRDRC